MREELKNLLNATVTMHGVEHRDDDPSLVKDAVCQLAHSVDMLREALVGVGDRHVDATRQGFENLWHVANEKLP